jgi:hypothetical protein
VISEFLFQVSLFVLVFPEQRVKARELDYGNDVLNQRGGVLARALGCSDCDSTLDAGRVRTTLMISGDTIDF